MAEVILLRLCPDLPIQRPGYLEFCKVSVFRCAIMILAYLLEQQIVQDRKQSYAKKEKKHQPFMKINIYL